MANAMIAAARDTGAVLVIASNLYGYGPVEGPMTPDLPLRPSSVKGRIRAEMWEEALALPDGRAVEVRGSDYVGPGSQSHLNRAMPALRRGKTVRVIGSPDEPHSWTFTEDMGATLAAVADRPEAWGRPWHAPCTATLTQRRAIGDLAAAMGVAEPEVVGLPRWQLAMAGLFNADAKAIREVAYQFERPFVSDDSQTREVLGLEPTPWTSVVASTVAGDPSV
jgi:nucleoside-diphosphate-sugar epimerase